MRPEKTKTKPFERAILNSFSNLNFMKILITGTAGFIGFHLAKRLLERGDVVVGVDNINDYYDVNLKNARLAQSGIDHHDLVYGIPQVSDKYENYT